MFTNRWLETHSINLPSPQVYWCNDCDHVKVNSEDKNTGLFLIQSGHHIHGNDDYHGVVYALCWKCLEDMFECRDKSLDT